MVTTKKLSKEEFSKYRKEAVGENVTETKVKDSLKTDLKKSVSDKVLELFVAENISDVNGRKVLSFTYGILTRRIKR